MRATLILAGGKGTRVRGYEKVLLTYQGESFLRRQIRILSPIVDEILISCRDEKQRDIIHDMVHFPCIVDKVNGMGPIQGIYAGFSEMRSDVCFLVAGDMPLLNPDVILHLFEKVEKDPSCAGIVPCWPNKDLEPLHAVYRKDTVLSYLNENENIRKVHSLIPNIPVQYLPVEELRIYDSTLRFFTNINTHEDIVELEQG
jgi:molybdopterin-guanine dinucleotide biosynthesis protein A